MHKISEQYFEQQNILNKKIKSYDQSLFTQ